MYDMLTQVQSCQLGGRQVLVQARPASYSKMIVNKRCLMIACLQRTGTDR